MKFKVLRDCYHGGLFYPTIVNGSRGPEANVVDYHGEEIPRHFEPADREAEKRVEQLTAAAAKELSAGMKPPQAVAALKELTRGKKGPTGKLAALQAELAKRRRAAREAVEDDEDEDDVVVDETDAGDADSAGGDKPPRRGRQKPNGE